MDAVDNEQHSALHWAIVCGELEALDLLQKAGQERVDLMPRKTTRSQSELST